MARSTEAKKVLRELEKELESASKRVGQNVVWSASEQTVLGADFGPNRPKMRPFRGV
jgi:hypothetical protein